MNTDDDTLNICTIGSTDPPGSIGELENTLGEPPKFFEEPIGEEEPISPTQTMDENRNNEIFPIKETNGEARMKC